MADERHRGEIRALALRGARAGVLGALAMALLMMMISSGSGSFWEPAELIGAAVFREQREGVLPVVLGLAIHLAVGATIGAIFAILTRRVASAPTEAMLGIVFGAAVFAPMTYLVLPQIDPVMFDRMHHGVLFVAHLVYGAIVAVALGAPASIVAASHRGPADARMR